MPDTRRRAAESTVGTQDGTRDAERPPEKGQETGEPCALKGASTVRRGADGKGLSRDTTCQRQEGLGNKRHLASRLLYWDTNNIQI